MSIESPCNKVCTLDASGQVCLGCFRTVEEIGQWSGLADGERKRVLERLPGRQSAFEAAKRARAADAASSTCERCGARFACGAGDPAVACWCTAYPPIQPGAPGAKCLCPACLAAVTTATGT